MSYTPVLSALNVNTRLAPGSSNLKLPTIPVPLFSPFAAGAAALSALPLLALALLLVLAFALLLALAFVLFLFQIYLNYLIFWF